jgi:hypothetical protein
MQPTRIIATALALQLITGCADVGTGPGGSDIDIDETRTAVADIVDNFFADNAGIQSLTQFQSQIAAALQPDSLAPLLSGPAPALPAHVSTGVAIPTELLGTTFEYNEQADRYEPSARSGAPPDGIRFILYEQTVLGADTTFSEIGHFDTVDKSDFATTPAVIDASFSAIVDTAAAIDYRITGEANAAVGDLQVAGVLYDATGQLDFDYTVSGSDAAGFDGTFAVASGDVTIEFGFQEQPTGVRSTEASVKVGANELLFVLIVDTNGDVQEGSGVRLDDVLVAVFSGNAATDAASISNFEGVSLTQTELLGLAETFVDMDWAYTVVERLFILGLDLIEVTFF